MMRLNRGMDGEGVDPPPPAVISREVATLSRHSTHATFSGIQRSQCFFRTSLCPDRCGHAGEVALFKIDRYISYEKLGQYGDPEAAQFHVRVDNDGGNGSEKQPEGVSDKVRALTVGQKVLLNWNHDYVTTTWEGGGSGKSPERPVTLLEPINE
jgi:hypothetical protein